MSEQIYAQRGTNQRVTVNAIHRDSNGARIYFTNDKGVTNHLGLNKFKKTHYHLSGPVV